VLNKTEYRRRRQKGNWQNPVDTLLFYCYNSLKNQIIMTVKLAIFKSGETLISNVKELIAEKDEDQKEVHGYLFIQPKKIDLNSPIFLSEENDKDSSIQVSLSSWSLLTKDTEFVIPKDWIVTFMEPVDRLSEMYEESLND
jgi:hypothetical protein